MWMPHHGHITPSLFAPSLSILGIIENRHSSIWYSCSCSRCNCSFLRFCPWWPSWLLLFTLEVNADRASCGTLLGSSGPWGRARSVGKVLARNGRCVWLLKALARVCLFLFMVRVLNPLCCPPQALTLPPGDWGSEVMILHHRKAVV